MTFISLFSDTLTSYVNMKFIKAAMRFKSITCSDSFPVKVWIKALVFWVHHSRKRGENSCDLITTIYSEEVEITGNPHYCKSQKILPTIILSKAINKENDKICPLSLEITICEHLFCLKETDLSDPGQSRIHTYLAKQWTCGWNRNGKDIL